VPSLLACAPDPNLHRHGNACAGILGAVSWLVELNDARLVYQIFQVFHMASICPATKDLGYSIVIGLILLGVALH